MPSKLSYKIKGMIFADRSAPRNGPTPTKDDAQTGLISDGAGPSFDGTGDAEAKDGTLPRERPSKKKRGQPPQQALKEQRKMEFNSAQTVRVWEDGTPGSTDPPVVKHYMSSCLNTPVRCLKTGEELAGEDMRILLNVGGIRHETHVTTLRNIPYSRLSRLAEYHVNSGRGKQEYFFDRHPAVFNAIIDFYRTGELHVPLEVCGAVVKRELDFWQIDELEIKACCWRHYRSYIENQRILDSFKHSLEHEKMEVDLSGLTGWRLWQMKIWLIMDHPRTSRMALAYGIVSFLFVSASIAGFCLETLPELRPEILNTTSICNGQEKNISVVSASNELLNVVDFICTVFFTMELVIRFFVSPSKLRFVRNPMNIIDLLALVPLYVQVIFESSELKACYMNERFVIEFMFILRIFRMFRIFHLVKHYQALKVLVYALRASLQELLMLFIFLLIAMLIFATMIYYAERSDGSTKFNTIPIWFWWAIITMTTVGYGDVVPSTPVGYVVGTACAVMGVLLVALTFPVISNNFTLFYTHVRSRSVAPRQKTEQQNLWGEEEEDPETEFKPVNYGSMAMQDLHSKAEVGTGDSPSSTVHMNGTANKTPSPQVPSRCVPIAKFSDASSMNDIIFQEPTEDIIFKDNVVTRKQV